MEYPEHDKLKAAEKDHAICSEFCEFLEEAGILTQEQCPQLLANHFEIDLKKFDAETEQMLKPISKT